MDLVASPFWLDGTLPETLNNIHPFSNMELLYSPTAWTSVPGKVPFRCAFSKKKHTFGNVALGLLSAGSVPLRGFTTSISLA